MTPRLDILPAGQRRLWPALVATRQAGFVLYEGTGVALQLGHRVSVDFDFFTEREFEPDSLRAQLPLLQQATTLQESKDTLVVLTAGSEQVKLSFFGRIGFGRICDPVETDDGVLLIASLQDLLASKVKVILQRSEAKDYRDIAAMIRAGVDLPIALAAAQKMYAPTFPVQAALKALTYFGDGDLAKLNASERKMLVDAAAAVDALPKVSIRAGLLPS